MPSNENGRRKVLDSITNLPLTVHDVTDVELEKIPPSPSTVGECHQATTQESCLQRHENELILDHVEWWSNPDSYLDHLRIQAALVAGVTAGFGAILVVVSEISFVKKNTPSGRLVHFNNRLLPLWDWSWRSHCVILSAL